MPRNRGQPSYYFENGISLNRLEGALFSIRYEHLRGKKRSERELRPSGTGLVGDVLRAEVALEEGESVGAIDSIPVTAEEFERSLRAAVEAGVPIDVDAPVQRVLAEGSDGFVGHAVRADRADEDIRYAGRSKLVVFHALHYCVEWDRWDLVPPLVRRGARQYQTVAPTEARTVCARCLRRATTS